jgi:hypothetical protein
MFKTGPLHHLRIELQLLDGPSPREEALPQVLVGALLPLLLPVVDKGMAWRARRFSVRLQKISRSARGGEVGSKGEAPGVVGRGVRGLSRPQRPTCTSPVQRKTSSPPAVFFVMSTRALPCPGMEPASE